MVPLASQQINESDIEENSLNNALDKKTCWWVF
jgi:hypothetical protein